MVTAQVSFSKQDLIENLTPQKPLLLFGVDWTDYEKISHEFGESSAFHITYYKGVLTLMPVSEIHELLTGLIHDFVRFTGMFLKLNIYATGKSTLQSKKRGTAVEPDDSFFVEKAALYQVKKYVPKEVEQAPDIAVEIDIYHGSEDKFEIYAEFGIAEFWQYSGETLRIFKLQEDKTYLESERSEQLPILSGAVLTEFLKRGLNEEQYTVLSDFQIWLQSNK